MKRFKARKRINRRIIYIGLFLISVAFSIRYLYRNDLVQKDTLIDVLISDSLGSYKSNIFDIDFLFKYALNIDLDKDTPVVKDDEDSHPLEVQPNPELEPIVYIYNTHQEEKYESPYLGAYNIATDVLIASKMLKEYLEDEGIGSYVEEESITNMIHMLNLKYQNSYEVSRIFMEKRKQEISTLQYFIDLHRDSSVYSKTTTTIDNEGYARILFVVGLEHDNYAQNLNLANKLADLVKEYNENLYRGIMQKSGAGVNGIYNQDFNANTMLIEVGGQYNNISEVNNTLKVLAKILAKYIKDDQNE